MVKYEIRRVSEDVLLDNFDVAPNLGDAFVVAGEACVVAAPPSAVVGGEGVVYVAKMA